MQLTTILSRYLQSRRNKKGDVRICRIADDNLCCSVCCVCLCLNCIKLNETESQINRGKRIVTVTFTLCALSVEYKAANKFFVTGGSTALPPNLCGEIVTNIERNFSFTCQKKFCHAIFQSLIRFRCSFSIHYKDFTSRLPAKEIMSWRIVIKFSFNINEWTYNFHPFKLIFNV